MKFENTEVWGFEHAIRGMRNPLESWSKSDSEYNSGNFCDSEFIVGSNDLELMQKLIKAGTPHRKFLRQIFVSVDITAPLYWWKEFDTYKVGTTSNSTSTMHKLASTPITKECFEMDDFSEIPLPNGWSNNTYVWNKYIIPYLELLREEYNETKDKRFWKELIRILPESWLQTRTITMNYENILNMIEFRKDHKLNEWSGKDNPEKPNFMSWVKSLPYAEYLFFL